MLRGSPPLHSAIINVPFRIRRSHALNRPGFTGEFFVQMLGDHIKVVQVCIEDPLCFVWRDVPDGFKQALGSSFESFTLR